MTTPLIMVVLMVGPWIAGRLAARAGLRSPPGAALACLGLALVFAAGTAIAGLAGMMISPITEASIGMGNEIIIIAFVVIIIGGIGSIKGAFVGALIVGLIDTLGRSYLDQFMKLFMGTETAETAAPAISAMLVYILMAIVLAGGEIRPGDSITITLPPDPHRPLAPV